MQRASTILAATMVAGALVALTVGTARAQLIETRTLAESVPVDRGAGLRIVVDNVFGPIRVTAHDQAVVDMTATETIRARTQSDLERARSEVGLRTEHDEGEVAFLARQVDDDCSCDCDCPGYHWQGYRGQGYVVEYDIELRVPYDASIDLSTVNGGEIVVDGVHGDFQVANVNGPVRLSGLRGTGRATTVNGRIDATFERAPAGETSFKTVNGRIEVAYPTDLSADLAFKTMRGEVWTDFEAEPLPLSPVSERTADGDRLVIRTERRSVVRVASGGSTHSFETLNGDIHVREVRR